MEKNKKKKKRGGPLMTNWPFEKASSLLSDFDELSWPAAVAHRPGRDGIINCIKFILLWL